MRSEAPPRLKQLEWVGQGEKLEQLMRSVQAGRIVHALLFSGPRGTGKRTAARWFAQAMLCRGEEKPCGVCPACKQFLAGGHPDVRVLQPEKNVIKVDAIRDLIEYLSLRPYEGGKHIAIIEQADRMNPNAQNALLKTLESPSGDVMFFLITDAPGGLLSTILSRCQNVRFAPLSVDDCASALEHRGIEPERARLLAGLAQGSVGRALEMDRDEAFFELRERVLKSLEMLNGSASVARAASGIAEEKGGERAVLEIMELWARDLMAVQNGAAPFEQSDAARLKRCKINGSRLLQSVMRAGQQLNANVSWTNELESMYFELAGAPC